MTNREEQSPEHPSPRRVRTMAVSVAKHLEPQKKNRFTCYQDDLVRIRLDLVALGVRVYVLRDGEATPVFESDGYHRPEDPGLYRPGLWTRYLEGLAERAETARVLEERRERERNFAPIDDGDLFAGRI